MRSSRAMREKHSSELPVGPTTACHFHGLPEEYFVDNRRAAILAATRSRLLTTFETCVASPWLHAAVAKLLRSLSEPFAVIPGPASECRVVRADASRGVLSTVGNFSTCGRHSASLAAKTTESVRLPRCHSQGLKYVLKQLGRRHLLERGCICRNLEANW